MEHYRRRRRRALPRPLQRALVLGIAVGLCGLIASVVACARPSAREVEQVGPADVARVAIAVAAGDPHVDAVATRSATGVLLQWASMEYFQYGPNDPVVELRVIVNHTGNAATQSTTIAWEPSFAESYTFVRSLPEPWRVRVDEQSGWGVMDTSGALPGQFGSFRIWFLATGSRIVEPNIRVVINGDEVIADVTATASYLRNVPSRSSQLAFERGPLASLAQVAAFVPSDERGAFALAATMNLSLVVLIAVGAIAAFRLAGRST